MGIVVTKQIIIHLSVLKTTQRIISILSNLHIPHMSPSIHPSIHPIKHASRACLVGGKKVSGLVEGFGELWLFGRFPIRRNGWAGELD